MAELIRGKVARILNEREIAINVGTLQGVEIGMYFDVMDTAGKNIKDPDTNEVLGSIERTKVRVEIVHTEEKLSLASTYRSIGSILRGAAYLGPFARSLMPPEWIEKYETLQTEDKGGSPIYYVKVGDPVVQVIEETE